MSDILNAANAEVKAANAEVKGTILSIDADDKLVAKSADGSNHIVIGFRLKLVAMRHSLKTPQVKKIADAGVPGGVELFNAFHDVGEEVMQALIATLRRPEAVTGTVEPPQGVPRTDEGHWLPCLLDFFDVLEMESHGDTSYFTLQPAQVPLTNSTSVPSQGLAARSVSPGANSATSTKLRARAINFNSRAAMYDVKFGHQYEFTNILKRGTGADVIALFDSYFQGYEALSHKEIKAMDWHLVLEQCHAGLGAFFHLRSSEFHLGDMGARDLALRCSQRLMLTPEDGPGVAALLKAFVGLLRSKSLQNDPARQKEAYVHLIMVAEISMDGRTDVFAATSDDDPTSFEDFLHHAIFVGKRPQLYTPLLTKEEATKCKLVTFTPSTDPLNTAQSAPAAIRTDSSATPVAPKSTPAKSYVTKQIHTKDLKSHEKIVEELRAELSELRTDYGVLQGQVQRQAASGLGAPPGQPTN
jgi:hypothetical protein